MEDVESEVWILVGKVHGRAAHRTRLEGWKAWTPKVKAEIARLRRLTWKAEERLAPLKASGSGVCKGGSGHVEKVKLPSFSGNIEDYAEFKSCFRLLCNGERYSAVLELAQMRTKLPKDAIQAIYGLTSPEEAWSRLDEMYGNREMVNPGCSPEAENIQTHEDSSA